MSSEMMTIRFHWSFNFFNGFQNTNTNEVMTTIPC